MGDGYPSDPVFVSRVGAFAVACADFPEFDGFIAGGGEKEVSFGGEGEVGDVVVVSEEGFGAEVVVVEVPQLDGEV